MIHPADLKCNDERIPLKGRIDAFDALRSLVILMVVVAHVCMTYMPDGPSWWFVTSERTDIVFGIFVHVCDIILMPALFFTAGYFTETSYIKRGFDRFLVDKVKHIFIPWLLAIFVVNPLAMLLAFERPLETISDKLAGNPLRLFAFQNHVWYLGILFLFFLFYALWARFFPPKGIRRSGSRRQGLSLLALSVVFSCMFASLWVGDIDDYYGWTGDTFLFVQFRPVKIASYVCFFLLGIYGWRTKWFTSEGWMPRIGPWRVLTLALLAGYFLVHALVIPRYDNPHATSLLLTVIDIATSFAASMYILQAAVRLQKSRAVRMLSDMSDYSYGIFWVHAVPLFFYLRSVNDLDVPIFFKWLVGAVSVTVVSWLLCKYVLKKVPGLKRMF